MAADSWIIKSGDRDNLYVDMTISDVIYPITVSLAELRPFATNQEALPKLRAKLVAARTAILDAKRIPANVLDAISYTEPF